MILSLLELADAVVMGLAIEAPNRFYAFVAEDLNISPFALDRLRTLRATKKFLPLDLYPGAPTEQIRLTAERAVNEMLDRLILAFARPVSKELLLSEFLMMLKHFEESDISDTEEREQACSYCEEVMDIVGVKSSDGVLNKWLYGFESGTTDEARDT